MTCLTAIVLTLDEATHLPGCLASLRPLTDRIIVLDSGSTDTTPTIAAEAGATVVTRPFDGYASQRNAALELAETDWVLFIDADERLTPDGAAEVRSTIASAPPHLTVGWLPRRNVFFGRTLRGGGWWPDEQARLLRRGRAHYDASRQVHEVVQTDGDSVHLTEPMVHLNYASRREFIAKQRQYTNRRVAQSTEPTPRFRAYLGAPARAFVRRFITLKGYHDRLTGLFLSSVLAIEEARAVHLLRKRGRQ